MKIIKKQESSKQRHIKEKDYMNKNRIPTNH